MLAAGDNAGDEEVVAKATRSNPLRSQVSVREYVTALRQLSSMLPPQDGLDKIPLYAEQRGDGKKIEAKKAAAYAPCAR
jgi:hypothetical protein